MITGLTACDNVSWGGVELTLETPPPPRDTVPVEEAVDEGPEPFDPGPLVYLVERSGEDVTALPVAEIRPAGLADLPTPASAASPPLRLAEAAMAPGTRLVLFADGRRAGTVELEELDRVDRTFCSPRPRVRGRVELVPEAIEVQRFLALPRDRAEGLGEDGDFEPRATVRSQRVASLNMASSLFVRMRVRWPASLLGSRADLRVFGPAGAAVPLLAATFVHRDALRIGPAPRPAWSLFYVAEDLGDGYTPTFIWYRVVGEEGKGAPRFLDHLDWDRDGREELLLEVLGADARWFASVRRDGPGWRLGFQDACATRSPEDPVASRP